MGYSTQNRPKAYEKSEWTGDGWYGKIEMLGGCADSPAGCPFIIFASSGLLPAVGAGRIFDGNMNGFPTLFVHYRGKSGIAPDWVDIPGNLDYD